MNEIKRKYCGNSYTSKKYHNYSMTGYMTYTYVVLFREVIRSSNDLEKNETTVDKSDAGLRHTQPIPVA